METSSVGPSTYPKFEARWFKVKIDVVDTSTWIVPRNIQSHVIARMHMVAKLFVYFAHSRKSNLYCTRGCSVIMSALTCQ